MYRKKLHQIAFLLANTLVCWGCGSNNELPTGSADRQTRIVMNVLSVFYGEYLESHRGQPPENQEDFRIFLETHPEKLKRYQIEELEQILNSPRDGDPFVIVCGKRRAPRDAPGTPWAAYEQTGSDGKRMAVQVRGGVYEMTANEIEQTFSID